MARESFANRYNLDAIDAQYKRWRTDPHAVDESWRLFFEGFELGQDYKPLVGDASRQQQAGIRKPPRKLRAITASSKMLSSMATRWCTFRSAKALPARANSGRR